MLQGMASPSNETAAADVIWEWDLGTSQVFWNEAVRERFGHDVELTTAEWWKDHIHPEDRERIVASIHGVIDGGEVHWRGEYRFLRADGHWAEVIDRGIVLRTASGAHMRMIGAMFDVTESRQAELAAELERTRLRAVIDAAPVGIFVADAKGKLVEMNEQARVIWGDLRQSESIAGYGAYKAWWNGTGELLRADDWGLARALQFGEVSIGEVLDIERFDGSRATIINNAAPIRDADDRIIGGVVAELDITDQKRIERELQEAKEVAEEANRAKDDFLATVSHELRTPLTAILGWARMITIPDLEPELLREALASIERNARAQAQLIEDILDVSRIVNGKLQLQVAPVALRDVIGAALATVRPAADAKSIVLFADLSDDTITVNGDNDRLQQVIWNLLSNAVKFTAAGGRVRVTLTREHGQARLAVSDDGQGIEAEFLPHVFQRFRQGDSSTTRRHGGLGLGLAIVRHLVELHGGTIEAASEGAGRGATFVMRVPLSRDKPALQHEDRWDAECPPRMDGLRVLLVDDQADTRRVIAAILEKCGATVTTAGSASEALILLGSGGHDMLVSDVAMPEADGYALVRQLRSSSSAAASIPAVALSAYAREEDREATIAAGFQSFVAKPVEPGELLSVLASLSESRTQAAGVPE
jgi:PAS domain S-box-containing protein